MTGYRTRILQHIIDIAVPLGPLSSGLDLGAGDGWFTKRLMELGIVSNAIGVELGSRKGRPNNVVTYDGKTIPFPDDSFDVTFIIDVLHHTESVARLVKEAARVTRKYIVIKDHTFNSQFQKLLLCGLDIIGNFGKGVDLPYNFQHSWEWNPIFEAARFSQTSMKHPLTCHLWLIGAFTNRLQYLGVWTKGNPK